MEKLPKNQKEYYQNKIRDYEKRTGKSMNVKGVSMFYDYKIEDAEYNFQAALDLMQKHACYIYNDSMVEEDPRSNGTHWRKFGLAHLNNKTYIYYFETQEWGKELDAITYRQGYDKKWKAGKLVKTKFPYETNKHIGSDFNQLCQENNIVLKRDVSWAIKMLDAGKMMTREGNRNLTLFPKKYDHAESTITTEDLFAEDWTIVQPKTFKDVLDDLYAGKTIRRKSWALEDWGVGKYANGYGRLIYTDLIADDWEVIDVVAEVNEQQKQILKDRNEH